MAKPKPSEDGSETTLRDVARLAGVSPATVSRVLNNDDKVGSAYRVRVERAIARAGYRPNRLAQNLRRRRSGTIALIIADITNAHFGEMVRAIEAAVHDRGQTVLVCATDEQPDKQARYLEVLLEERVRGVIVSPADPAAKGIGQLIDQGIPVVAVDREVEDPRADAVVADNVGATRAATELLTAAGRRDLVLVSGRSAVETGAERLAGFELAMRTAGLTPRHVDGGFRFDRAHDAVAKLLRGSSPDALIAANNLMALGALKALHEAGVQVPTQTALVAIDDPPWAELLDPPLTTVAQPVEAMAIDALRLLDERIAGDDRKGCRIVHPFELRVRASCGTDPPKRLR